MIHFDGMQSLKHEQDPLISAWRKVETMLTALINKNNIPLIRLISI